MNVIILCDNKPQSCEKCMFHHETIEETQNGYNITKKCFLGSESINNCPLTEINTVFSDDPNIIGATND